MRDPLREIACGDGRYSPEAFKFLFESLEFAVQRTGREGAEGAARHVTGQELLEGMREYALHIFGPLAGEVWRAWGVKTTLDWGHIVFLLVDKQMLNRQENDTIDDFRNGFDFDEAFLRGYRVTLPPEVGARKSAGDE